MGDTTNLSGVRSDTGPFSIIPEWLVDADVSDRAIRLYALLGRYADREGSSFPSRRTIAERLKCSLDSVDRAKKELVDAGALHVEERRDEGGQRSNEYTILRLPSRTGAEGPLGTGAAQNENHVEREDPSGPQAPAEISGEGGPRSTESSSRKRNLVWEALDELFHPSTPSERSNVGKTERELRQAWARQDRDTYHHGMPGMHPLAEGSPGFDERLADEIRRRVAAYWPNLTITPNALRKHWSELGRRADELASSERPPGGVITREWMLAKNGPCQTCGGDGTRPGSDIPFTCSDCGGTGVEGWVA